MENKYNNNILFHQDKKQLYKYNQIPKYNFYPNQINRNQLIENKIKNLNINNDINISSNIYENNIEMLKEKIKEQEKDIIYLNDRLKNYDITMEEITKLNIELNKLNEIIREKDYTILEYREITELSKKKFDELIQNKNNLMQRIKQLENENKELKNTINNFENNFYIMKKDLNNLIKEDRELKEQLYEKNKKIKYMNDLLEKLNINKNNYIKYNKNKIINFNETNQIKENHNNKKYNNYYLKERSRTPLIQNIKTEENDIPNKKYYNLNKDYSLRTEPNNNIFTDFKNI